MINQFIQLLQIPSTTGKEAMTVKYLQSYLAKLGYKTWQDSAGNVVGSNCGNLYAYLELDPKFETIVFSAHTDTVLPIGSQIKPIVNGDKICSDGSTILGADNRAGIAAILAMAQRLEIKKMKHNLLLFFPVHEESGKMGSSLFVFDKRIRYIFNVDESNSPGNFIYASLSHLSFEIEVHGKSAHASKSYDKGVNAIVAASRFISKLRLGVDKKIGWTMNIGKIEGGGGTNVVPDFVLIQGEVRSFSDKVLKSKILEIRRGIKVLEKTMGVKFDLVLKKYDFVPPFDGAKDPILSGICRVACEEVGLKSSFSKSLSSSDANSFSALGYRVISIARGGAKPHSKSEYIYATDLEKTAQLLERLLYLC